MFVEVCAGSDYGMWYAYYEVVEDRLVLRDEGNHDNLEGNQFVLDFESLTLDQAYDKRNALNSQGSGHAYDGCHACKWSIGIRELDVDQVPEHLTYSEPQEAAIIRAALDVYHKCPGAFKRLKAAIRAT